MLLQVFFRRCKPARPLNAPPILRNSVLLNIAGPEGISFMSPLAAESLFEELRELMSPNSEARYPLLRVLSEMVQCLHN